MVLLLGRRAPGAGRRASYGPLRASGATPLIRPAGDGPASREIASVVECAIQFADKCYPECVDSPARRKTSFEVDFTKVEQAKAVLGTTTLTDTIDAALGEVIRLHDRRRLVEMLFTPGVLDLDDGDVMRSAWR